MNIQLNNLRMIQIGNKMQIEILIELSEDKLLISQVHEIIRKALFDRGIIFDNMIIREDKQKWQIN